MKNIALVLALFAAFAFAGEGVKNHNKKHDGEKFTREDCSRFEITEDDRLLIDGKEYTGGGIGALLMCPEMKGFEKAMQRNNEREKKRSLGGK
jgi:hypothetical protein